MIKKIILKINQELSEIGNKIFGRKRQKQLLNKDFTIISNNCWGGKIYKYFNLPYKSPTCGLYFTFDNYIKFCSNFKYYLSLELKEINVYDSNSLDVININHTKEEANKLIVGALGDVEIIFLHYHSFAEAKNKWDRRCSRVDLSKPILFKCNDTNGFSEEYYYKWDNLKLDNKLFITSNDNIKGSDVIHITSKNKLNLVDDTSYFFKDFKKYSYLNIINEMFREN